MQLGRVTLRQYFFMMKATRLRLIDKERDIHAQAWLNVQAKATKQRGKKTVPYFRSFDEFFKLSEDTLDKHKQADEQDALKAMVLRANIANSG